MFKLVLCSDIHLNFLNLDKVTKFAEKIFHAGPDAVLITGDISEANQLGAHLRILLAVIDKPLYFVLGNHDYWYGSFQKTDDEMKALAKEDSRFVYLANSEPILLSNKTALVGVDGWYDAGYGNWKVGGLFMNDWVRIEDFASGQTPSMYGGSSHSKGEYISISRRKAAADAQLGEKLLLDAFSKRDHVIFATHVPPWPDVARYRGRPTDTDALPYYTSKTMGNMLEDVAKQLPIEKSLTVFCGHTHDKARHRVSHNLEVFCSPADYGNPGISEIISIL